MVPVWRTPPDLIDACLASVRGQSDAQPPEIVLVDDGWGGVSRELARSHDAVLVSLSDNRGPGPARNAGVEAAGGEYVYFLDADDLLAPGTLAALGRALESRPALVYTDRARVSPDARRTLHLRDHAVWPGLLERFGGGPFDPLLHTTLLQGHQACRRDAFLGTGGFGAELGGEHELMLRLAEQAPGEIRHAPGALYLYRERHGSLRHDAGRFGSVIATVERNLAAAARRRGLDVVSARRLGRLRPTFVPVYELLRADGSRLAAPWIEYDELRLAASS